MDLKAPIAYSSIGYKGILVIGRLSKSEVGQYGRLVIM